MYTPTAHNYLTAAIEREWGEIQAALAVIPEAPSPDQLLDTAHLSRLLQISPRTLESWRARGEGPAVTRVGSATRYHFRDVLLWLDAQNR